jgi:hypothetical protein
MNNLYELSLLEKYQLDKPQNWQGVWEIDDVFYRKIFAYLIRTYQTNVLEIGAHSGCTTYFFGKMLEKYNKIIYTIDPWNGQQEGDESIYQMYLNNIQSLNNIVTNRDTSLSPSIHELLKNMEYGICYIDGLHTTEGIRNDIQLVTSTISTPGMIIIDDYDMDEVKQEISNAVQKDILKIIEPPNIEMYNNNYPNKGRKFVVCQGVKNE